MKAVIAVVAVIVLAGGGYVFTTMSGAGNSDFGAAAPVDSAADIAFDWFITEGELSLGTSDIRTPRGVNVKLMVDSDANDELVIPGLGIRFQLAADQNHEIRFNAYKTGQFAIQLRDANTRLGSLEIYPADNS